MTGSNDNSSLGLYKAVEKTDENGNNYFAYEEMFTGQSSILQALPSGKM